MTDSKKPINNRTKVLVIIVAVSLCGVGYHLWLRSLPQRYTVAEIRRTYKAAKSGDFASFYYNLDSVEYMNSTPLEEDRDRHSVVGKRYLVSVPIGHEGSGRLMWDRPVPKGINAPPEGWKEIPRF